MLFGFSSLLSILIEQAEDNPKIDPKYEKNATYPGLAHPTSLKLQPIRVSQLCLRSAYLHQGNALSALGRDEEAREVYRKVLPMLESEPRCGRLDWERSSIHVNIGNTFSRQGNFDLANEQYSIAEQLGKDHEDAPDGNKTEGMSIMVVAMRARAFALKKADREEEAKARLREVLDLDMKVKKLTEEEKQKLKEKELSELKAEEVVNPTASEPSAQPVTVA